MPMIRGLRTLNAIENGTVNGAALETLLADGGRKSDFDGIMTMPGTSSVMAASTTAMTAIGNSTTALNSVMSFPTSRTAIANATSALATLYANPTAVTTMAGNTAMQSTLSSNTTSFAYTTTVGRAALGSFLLNETAKPYWYSKASWERTGSGLNNVSASEMGTGTWTSITSSTNNGIYVAVAVNTIKYSYDGANWNSVSGYTVPTNYRKVVYGNGMFVAVGNGASSSYSTDGINWTTGTLPAGAGSWTLTFANGYFVAVRGFGTDTNVAAYSTDGINWTTATLPATASWSSVTYGNGKFVAVAGINTAGTITAYSTNNGATWTSGTGLASANWVSVTYGNGKFVAVAGYSHYQGLGTSSSSTAYSTDGITWTNSSLPGSYPWTDVAYGNGYFVAVAGTGVSSPIAVSGDGISWSSLLGSNDGDYNYTYLSCVYYDGMKFLIPCYNSYVGIRMLARDLALLYQSAHGYRANIKASAVTFGNNKFVMVGNGYSWVSTDGKSWKRYAAPALATGGPGAGVDNDGLCPSVAYGNGVFISTVARSSGTSNRVAISTDGINWKTSLLPNNYYNGYVAYGNGRWIVSWGYTPQVGNGVGLSSYSTSTDNGITWTTGSLPNATYFGPVVWTGSSWIIAAAASTIYTNYSTNGTSWTGNNLNWTCIGMASNGSITIAISTQTQQQYAYTTTGASWTYGNLPSSAQWGAPTYHNGYFYVFEVNGFKYAYSTDGINWTQGIRSTAGAGTYTSTGGNGFILTQDYSGSALGQINL